ncbi:hypothetical protein NC652_018013 [Populus alba x Populus x berolinensis]|nr:hypothetical protein NC652_018013 [Populus alba x Populus x berolinensis]
MNRADGQAAKDEMQGVIVYEYELKIGWGKSVALPSQALPAPPPGQMAIRSKEGATVILSGPSGPPVTSVPNQNSELGDTLQRWRTEPFIMITDGYHHLCPQQRVQSTGKESGSTHAAGRSRRVDPERTLTDPQRDEFEDMVVEVLTESLTLKETPIPTKVAKTHACL